MTYRIVINSTENDTMHIAMLRLACVKDVAAAACDNVTVAVIWECESDIIAYAQAKILWDELIPARIISEDGEEIAMVNNIINHASSGEIF